MKSSPLILNSLDDVGRRLVRIEAKSHDPKNEAWLQELIYRHPELLPVDEFDDTFAPAIPIGREVPTARGPIDNLYVSPDGGITVVETKLWKNPEKHRTVVAQVIDYAKELATWDYDQLCSAVLSSSRRRKEQENASLEDKVAPILSQSGTELHEFQESVASCLAEATFLLLIAGDRISPNIAFLTQSIQSAPGLGFTLGLVEVQLFAHTLGTDWPLIVVPEVVGRTVEKTRGVVQVRYSQEKPDVTVEIDGGVTGVPQFDWELFLKEVPSDLVEPFEAGKEKWEDVGGRLRYTRSIIWEIEIQGAFRKLAISTTKGIAILNRNSFARRLGESLSHHYNDYLKHLDKSSAAADCGDEKMWLGYDRIQPSDLDVILDASIRTVESIKEQSED